MKIQANSYDVYNKPNLKHQNFGILYTQCSIPNVLASNTTFFFREPRVLEKAVDHLADKFAGQNTAILDYACSDGAEALSLLTLLTQKKVQNHFKIFGLDIDPVVIERAKKGVYEIDKYEETLLYTPLFKLQGKARELKEIFCRYMTEVRKDSVLGLDISMIMKPEAKKYIKFEDSSNSNILDVKNCLPKEKVSAVFARNLLYILFQKQCGAAEYDKRVAQKLVVGLYSRLEKNGIVVLGKAADEHYYKTQGTLQKPLEIEFLKQGFSPLYKSRLFKNKEESTPVIWEKV